MKNEEDGNNGQQNHSGVTPEDLEKLLESSKSASSSLDDSTPDDDDYATRLKELDQKVEEQIDALQSEETEGCPDADALSAAIKAAEDAKTKEAERQAAAKVAEVEKKILLVTNEAIDTLKEQIDNFFQNVQRGTIPCESGEIFAKHSIVVDKNGGIMIAGNRIGDDTEVIQKITAGVVGYFQALRFNIVFEIKSSLDFSCHSLIFQIFRP